MKRLLALLAALGAALAYVVVRRRGREEQYGYVPKHDDLAGRPDDATLVDNVRSEIFRDVAIASDKIDVNAEQGRVVLRGEVDEPELIDELVARARSVQGVEDVENLLHVAAKS